MSSKQINSVFSGSGMQTRSIIGFLCLRGKSWLRLFATPRPEGSVNLWSVPNLLLQKLPARNFTVTTAIDASNLLEGERSGLVMMGRDYSYLAVDESPAGLRLIRELF